MLLEGRRYQRKTLLGQKRIRALFTLPGGGAPIPTYLPDALAEKLPLFRRFRAKAVVELRPQEELSERVAQSSIAFAPGRHVPSINRETSRAIASFAAAAKAASFMHSSYNAAGGVSHT